MFLETSLSFSGGGFVANIKRFMPTVASKVRPVSELGNVGVSRLMLSNEFSSTTVNHFQFEFRSEK